MPGMGLVLEDQHGAFVGGTSAIHVIQIIRSAQKAQAARSLASQALFHIDQHGDQAWCGKVGVNLAVARRRKRRAPVTMVGPPRQIPRPACVPPRG